MLRRNTNRNGELTISATERDLEKVDLLFFRMEYEAFKAP